MEILDFSNQGLKNYDYVEVEFRIRKKTLLQLDLSKNYLE